MSVMMSSPTVDPFGISSTFPEKVRRLAPSTVNTDLLDATIQSVLSSWEQWCDAPLGRFAYVPAVHLDDRPYPQLPHEAFEYIRDVLHLNNGQVSAAIDVQERTYYNWLGKPKTKPRTSSLGRLWPMVDALFHLQVVHPNIAGWFHSTPAAQEAFHAGDLNRFLQLELEYTSAHSDSLTTTSIPAPYFGDPGDLVINDSIDNETVSKSKAPRVRPGARRGAKLPAMTTVIDEER